jgi:hypothetical protein
MVGTLMYIHGENMDVHPWWEHGCTFMERTWMFIHGGNMDVHSWREHGCTSMTGTCIYVCFKYEYRLTILGT